MRITQETYELIRDLCRRATNEAPSQLEDVRIVGDAIRGGLGHVEPEFFRAYVQAGDALKRLLKGFGGPENLGRLADVLSPSPISSTKRRVTIPRVKTTPRKAAQAISPDKLYGRSRIMQCIKSRSCQNSFKIIKKLIELRPKFIDEQKAISTAKGLEPIEDFTLSTIAQILEAGEKLQQGRHKKLMRLAALHDIFDYSKTLQQIPDECFETPETLVEKLVAIHDQVVDDLNNLPQPNPELIENISFNMLTKALEVGGRIKENAWEYMRQASFRDLYEKSHILQGISDDVLATTKTLISELVRLRPKIIREQQSLQSPHARKKIKGYALVTLVLALKAGGKLPRIIQTEQRWATAYDLYTHSTTLQTLSPQYFATPESLRKKLLELQPTIEAELREWHKKTYPHGARKNFSISPATLIQALLSAGRLDKQLLYKRHVNNRNLFDRSPTLRQIPSEVLANNFSVLLFLAARRDRIAVEVFKAQEKLSPDEFIFPNAHDYYSVRTLVGALIAGGVIEQERGAVIASKAKSIDYLLRQRDTVEPELNRLIKKWGNRIPKKEVDHSKFPRRSNLKEPDRRQIARTLTDASINDVVCYGRMFLTHPEAAIRSIFAGDELAFCALFPHYFSGNLVPKSIVKKLESAGSRTREEPNVARREAVEALQEILNHYKDKEVDQPTTGEYLKRVGWLVDWNQDALGNSPTATDSIAPFAMLPFFFPFPTPVLIH